MKLTFTALIYRIILLLVLVSSSKTMVAQILNYDWSIGAGSATNDYANDVAVDASGNSYITGRYSNTIDMDPGVGVSSLMSAGSDDIVVAKFDPAGNLVWAKGIGSTGQDNGIAIALNSANHVYVTGSFANTVDFDPGAGVSNFTATGSIDAFILELDNNGNFVWAQTVTGILSESILDIQFDASDNFVIGGYVTDDFDMIPGPGVSTFVSPGGNDGFVMKFDNLNTHEWTRTVASTADDNVQSVDVDASGNVIAHGYFSNTFDFDPGAGTLTLNAGVGNYDVFIWKLTSTGNLSFAKQIGGFANDMGRSVLVDPSDNIYLTGVFSGTADLDPSSSTMWNEASAGLTDAYLLKLDQSGNLLWLDVFGGTGNDLPIDLHYHQANDEILVAGRFYDSFDFGNMSTPLVLVSMGDQDGFLYRADSDGNPIDVIQMGGTGADISFGVAGDDAIIVVGQFQATADFDFNNTSGDETTVGISDIFTASYSVCTLPEELTGLTGSSGVCENVLETYVVNSSVGAVDYTWTAPSGWTGTSATNSIDLVPSNVSGSISVVANNACGSSSPLTIFVDAYDVPVVTASDIEICPGESVSLIATTDIVSNIYWYDALTGGSIWVSGSPADPGPILTSTSFYAEAFNGPCSNNPREEVVVTIKPLPDIIVSVANGTFESQQVGADSYQWVDCNNSSLPISGETAQSFVPSVDGSYAVIVVLDGCLDTSACQQIYLSQSEFETDYFLVYPNPSTKQFTILIPPSGGNIVIRNITGQEILNTNVEGGKLIIENETLASGVYVIEITSGFEKLVQQLIIK